MQLRTTRQTRFSVETDRKMKNGLYRGKQAAANKGLRTEAANPNGKTWQKEGMETQKHGSTTDKRVKSGNFLQLI